MSVVSEIISPRKIVSLKIESTPSALDATKLMISKKVSSVVIVDYDRKPVGIISERDILKKVTAANKNARGVAAQDIMSYPVITIKTYDSIETAAAVMAKNKIKRLVVLEEDGALAGVLSVSDITRKLARILALEYGRYGRLKSVLGL